MSIRPGADSEIIDLCRKMQVVYQDGAGGHGFCNAVFGRVAVAHYDLGARWLISAASCSSRPTISCRC